jgi:hypothetical protein
VQDSGNNLMSQTPETFEDTRELNQTLNQWNNLQDRLSEGGFTTAALKPKQEERLQEKLAAAEQRFQDLYWNVRDELSYLEPMRRQLAEVLQKQAGSLPNVTLSSNLLAQAENYAQQFKAQKGDLDGLEELKILYSELQTYLWVTQLFIEQDSPNQEVVEALRKLKGQVVNHSEYLAQEYKLFETGDPAEIAAENQKIEMLSNELEVSLADLSGGFQIQANLSTADLKAQAQELIKKLRSLKNSKNISQRLKTLRSTREFLQAEIFSKNRETVMILASGGLAGKNVLGETLIKVTLALFEAEQIAEKFMQTACSNWEAVNRILTFT